jgi:hypothetical protein
MMKRAASIAVKETNGESRDVNASEFGIHRPGASWWLSPVAVTSSVGVMETRSSSPSLSHVHVRHCGMVVGGVCEAAWRSNDGDAI